MKSKKMKNSYARQPLTQPVRHDMMAVNKSILICLLLLIPAFECLSRDNKQAVLSRLDSCLAQSDKYDDQKEKRISALRHEFNTANSPAVRYDKSIALFHEYSSYKYDSAYVYAHQAMRWANVLNDGLRRMEAGCAKVFCQSSAGFYKEAFETFADVVLPKDADTQNKALYYETAARLNYDISDYNLSQSFRQDYVDRGDVYTDSLLRFLPANSEEWWMATARRQMKQDDYLNGFTSFNQYLKIKGSDLHSQAIALSSIGWILLRQGKTDEGLVAIAEAAICDLQSSTKETTALCMLAELLYNQHDVHRATRYIHVALQNGHDYGARQRLVQVGNILPIIEAERAEILEQQRTVMMVFGIAALLMSVVIALLAWQAIRKSRKLREANKQIASRNQLLEEANQTLAQTNQKLKEADRIKAEYIGTSFYSNSVYMEKLEKIFLTLNRKMVARKYDDLRDMLGGALLKDERNDLFANFDNTFLNIFPTFVDQYNQLFPPEEQCDVKPGESMTSEMRIFALIRLGITDSERIAHFLGKSVNTINTYKSRVKNKSIVKNEEFEGRIMLIG